MKGYLFVLYCPDCGDLIDTNKKEIEYFSNNMVVCGGCAYRYDLERRTER